jgi:hypothetical protein
MTQRGQAAFVQPYALPLSLAKRKAPPQWAL